jgi:hypothetical protein
MGEEVCGYARKEIVFKVAGGVGFWDRGGRGGEREEPLGGNAEEFIAPRNVYQID